MALSLKDKIVFITGASSGIGKACAHQFASLGARIIISARRVERLQELAQDLQSQYNIDVLPVELDVQDKGKVSEVVDAVTEQWGPIAILVNNAGLGLDSTLFQDGISDNWDTMIDTNIKGLLYVTRKVLPNMIKSGVGHIINIGSIAGHEYYSRGNIYSATKHAVNAINKSLRIDLLGTGVRVSQVSPGAVHTEFSEVRWKDKHRADEFYQGFEPLQADDIADGVLYCATRPQHVDVEELTIMPTAQASCSHLHKEGKSAAMLLD